MSQIAVFGAGSYGTSLAIQLARNGCDTLLWGRNDAHRAELAKDRVNTRYLPDCPFPAKLQVADSLEQAAAIEFWLLAVPSHALGHLLESLKPLAVGPRKVACATKGFEPDTGRLAHEVVSHALGNVPFAIVSGPTFAKEVGRGLPSAITIASRTPGFAAETADELHGPGMRAYTSDDVIGVEVGGGVKNVIAIAVGAADGMGLGANTRALLITRGIREIMRLGEAMGGQRDTLMGLSGMGDLVLTCTDDQSRNRRLGKALGAGQSIDVAQQEIGQVVEGVRNAVEVNLLAERHQVDMPISKQVYRVLHNGIAVRQAFYELSARPPGAESR
ncbi:MAG: NAD(P)H-dependent glycerol-3-phosphate dehydrogenase [Oceanococcus sp.]